MAATFAFALYSNKHCGYAVEIGKGIMGEIAAGMVAQGGG